MLHVCKTWRASQRAAPSNHIIHELIRDNVSRQSQEDGNYHLNLSDLRHHYSEEFVNHHDVISMRFLSTAKRLAQQVPRIHAAAASILISGCGTGDTALELAKLWTTNTAIAHLTFVDGLPDMLRQTEIKLDIVNNVRRDGLVKEFALLRGTPGQYLHLAWIMLCLRMSTTSRRFGPQ